MRRDRLRWMSSEIVFQLILLIRESHGGRNFRWIRTEVQGALNSAPETYQDEKKRTSSSVVLSTAVPLPEIGGG